MKINYLNLWYIQGNEKGQIMRDSWNNVYLLCSRKML